MITYSIFDTSTLHHGDISVSDSGLSNAQEALSNADVINSADHIAVYPEGDIVNEAACVENVSCELSRINETCEILSEEVITRSISNISALQPVTVSENASHLDDDSHLVHSSTESQCNGEEIASDSEHVPLIPQLEILQCHVTVSERNESRHFLRDHAYFTGVNLPHFVPHNHSYGRNVRNMRSDCGNDHLYLFQKMLTYHLEVTTCLSMNFT